MVFSPQKYDRMEMELLNYHYPKAEMGAGGAEQQVARAVDLPKVVRDLGLKGREAMIQRAYSKFCKEGIMVRAGFGFKMTEKGIQMVKEYKKLYST